MKTIATILAVSGISLLTTRVQAQLIIDRSGAREALYGATNRADLLKGGKNRVSFDTKDKSLSLALFEQSDSFLGLGGSSVEGAKLQNWLYVLRAKVKATDGWSDFIKFEKLPYIELSLLVNYTAALSKNTIGFTNIRTAYRHEEFDVFDPVGGNFKKPSFDGVDVQWAGGVVFVQQDNKFLANWGMFASAGYTRANNYEQLPQVEVSDIQRIYPLPGGGNRIVTSGGKKTRLGSLTESNTVPMDFGFTFEIPVNPEFVKKIPFVPGKKDTKYSFILSPYGRYNIDLQNGSDSHGVGMVVTIKSKKDLIAGGEDPFEKGLSETKFPTSVFVERTDAFGKNAVWQAGMNVVWHF